jgi:hypothetical protein
MPASLACYVRVLVPRMVLLPIFGICLIQIPYFSHIYLLQLSPRNHIIFHFQDLVHCSMSIVFLDLSNMIKGSCLLMTESHDFFIIQLSSLEDIIHWKLLNYIYAFQPSPFNLPTPRNILLCYGGEEINNQIWFTSRNSY